MWMRTGLAKSEMVMYQQVMCHVFITFYAVTDDLFTLMQFLSWNEDKIIYFTLILFHNFDFIFLLLSLFSVLCYTLCMCGAVSESLQSAPWL